MEWNYRENHTHGIHFGDKSSLRCKIGLSATHIQDPKFIVTFLVNPSGAYGRSPSGPAALWVAARRAREPGRPLAYGRRSTHGQQRGATIRLASIQGFQIFKSATLSKSASLVARLVNWFRFIIAR